MTPPPSKPTLLERLVIAEAADLETIASLRARIRELEAGLQKAVGFLQDAPLSSGVCCCGSPIEGHGYGDGHSPVDDLQYHAGNLQQEFTALLNKEPTP